MTKLHRFEGREVIGTKIAITGAGDGLSEAMSIEPEELRLGEKVFVVLEAEVSKITHTQVKDTDSLIRVQNLKAGVATLVDEDMVADVLAEQREKNRRAAEEKAGVTRLDFGDGADDEGDEDEGDG